MFLDGFGPIIWQGTLVTLELSVLSLLLAFAIGLVGAGAKLSHNPLLGGVSTLYTTLVRGVPDLVLMLLIFYSLQIGMNKITEALRIDQIDLDPFVSGIVTLGFIYGAYFTETLRGAFLSVPKGQIEAGIAYGMTSWQVFHRVQFPQMMRFALPGISNNWQVMLKATALVSIIGLADVVKASVDAGKSTYKVFFFTLVAGAIYLALTTLSNFVLAKLERRYSTGVREADL
ncbi:ABC-type arginine transport system, permease component [Chromobacterium violaceum]|uniref:Histidine ABC transporter permease n=1 Tax=Chromobacterium violaceum TaxID=536 RepID=A0A202BB43_CHRVL|nr:histidine ABC transporter permease HisQ [Chromobacterium violaceum]KJH69094.1 histidine ABC transporter permease [Chromobacterium violaceum]KMN50610.1 histidine ABC transporter permease [Chromobacterium violaceum]KMN87105.1 histidine ABC transporter permease [Chromobacterium violaceum]KMN89770.1 histidine ABC transporter permease [Chromobacterium violaceum]KMO03814.1 histidine ABC transporter permease [Chromobacterium violaceum]